MRLPTFTADLVNRITISSAVFTKYIRLLCLYAIRRLNRSLALQIQYCGNWWLSTLDKRLSPPYCCVWWWY